jgi:hypothetical protein
MPIKEIDTLPKQSDRLAALEFENSQLRNRIAALEARMPPEPKNLTLDDLTVIGGRPSLPKPDESWLPSWQECATLAIIVEKKYPELVIRSDDWVVVFRRALLALSHIGRANEPNHRYAWSSFKNRCCEWLADRHLDNDLDYGPFLAAVAASGDIPFSGFAARDCLAGIQPSLGLAVAHESGKEADLAAWKRVLSSGKLIGEAAAAQAVNRYPGRHDNPRSHVEMLPQYDR